MVSGGNVAASRPEDVRLFGGRVGGASARLRPSLPQVRVRRLPDRLSPETPHRMRLPSRRRGCRSEIDGLPTTWWPG